MAFPFLAMAMVLHPFMATPVFMVHAIPMKIQVKPNTTDDAKSLIGLGRLLDALILFKLLKTTLAPMRTYFHPCSNM